MYTRAQQLNLLVYEDHMLIRVHVKFIVFFHKNIKLFSNYKMYNGYSMGAFSMNTISNLFPLIILMSMFKLRETTCDIRDYKTNYHSIHTLPYVQKLIFTINFKHAKYKLSHYA